jgi:endonuclease G, mitochondrial
MRIFSIVLLTIIISCQKNSNDIVTKSKVTIEKVKTTEESLLPSSTTNAVIKHEGYTLSYAEEHEQSEWVAYQLTDGKWKYNTYERPFFEQDDAITTASAHWRNYKKSGYTKGHLCPAADQKQSYERYKETFLTSNASPQEYNFNAGIWERLEEKTRYVASTFPNGIYVVTGGVLEENLETIGTEEVSIPNYFYKIWYSEEKNKMLGFLVPHEDSDKPLANFAVSVDEIEKRTGIDFFEKMDKKVQESLEKNSDYKSWLKNE